MFLLSQDNVIYNLKDIHKIKTEYFEGNMNKILLFTDRQTQLIHNDENVYVIYSCDDKAILDDVYKEIISRMSRDNGVIDVPKIIEDVKELNSNTPPKSAADYLPKLFPQFFLKNTTQE